MLEDILEKIGNKKPLNLKQAILQVSNTTGQDVSKDEHYSENEKMNLKCKIYKYTGWIDKQQNRTFY